MFWGIISIIVVALDQVTKWMIEQIIPIGTFKSIIPNFFYVTNVRNQGAAWGIFADHPTFLFGLIIIALVMIIWLFFQMRDSISRISISVILGGAIGNIIDRIFRGSVVDFLDFYFGNYHYPTFNFADISIVCGTIILLYATLFRKEDTTISHNKSNFQEK